MIELSADSQLTYYDPDARTYAPSAVAQWWAGWYAAYDFINAASFAAALVNLTGIGPDLPGTGVLPTQTPGIGMAFSGAQYLKTAIGSFGATFSAIVKFNTVTTPVQDSLFGMLDNSGSAAIQISSVYSFVNRIYFNISALIFAGKQVSATMGMAGTKAFLNGSPEAGIMPYAGGLIWPTDGFYIGTRNYLNAPNGGFLTGIITSIAFDNTVRSDADMAAISLAMP